MNENRPMTNEDFEQWKRLPIYIATRHFSKHFARGSRPQNRPRPLELDDLVSEGNKALVEAWNLYSPEHESGSKFISFAYRVIKNHMFRLVAENRSYNQHSYLTSEDDLDLDEKHGLDFSNSDLNNVDEEDFTAVCFEKLKRRLPKKDFDLLYRRFGLGWSMARLAKRIGCSGEHARKKISELQIKAASVMQEED